MFFMIPVFEFGISKFPSQALLFFGEQDVKTFRWCDDLRI